MILSSSHCAKTVSLKITNKHKDSYQLIYIVHLIQITLICCVHVITVDETVHTYYYTINSIKKEMIKMLLHTISQPSSVQNPISQQPCEQLQKPNH